MLSPMINFVRKFLREEDGPTAVEYSVMLALIVAVCIVAIGTVGGEALGLFDFISGKMNDISQGNPL